MATVTHAYLASYVANILGEHAELIDAILSNDDNLSYGSIITVSTGPDEYQTAITSQGIEELRDFIADFRRSPEEWDDLLHSIIDDPDIIQAVKDHKPR
ncbi:MAG: hypothetical protein P4L87_15320 [Formivibrio sp.]|nr:hypothetical protein [Formivibrio sp.]